jgi:hypothetical protein
LPILRLELADTLLLGGQRLAKPRAASRLLVELLDPSANRALDEIHVAAHLAYAQSLVTDHLHDLQLEGRIERAPCSLLCHLRSVLVWEKSLSRCPFRLDHGKQVNLACERGLSQRRACGLIGVSRSSLSTASTVDSTCGQFCRGWFTSHARPSRTLCPLFSAKAMLIKLPIAGGLLISFARLRDARFRRSN